MPSSRQPGVLIKINGNIILSSMSFEVDNNTYYEADTFRIVFAVAGLPKDKTLNWFSQQTELICEIFAGFPSDPSDYKAQELQSLILGKVDELNFNPVENTIELIGRDFTASLIDTKTTEKWPNHTASDIATLLAKRHGLTPVVTSTTTQVGRYYQIDHAALTDERSEWDILTWLAHQEQFLVFVKGNALHFQPKPTSTQKSYELNWQASNKERGYPVFNGTELHFSRNLTLAKGVVVTVRSWNAKQKKGFSVSYPRTAKPIQPGHAIPSHNNQLYSYVIPGLTVEQALQRAQSLLQAITAHEVTLKASLPADNQLSITDVIRVRGTNTSFDQLYYPDSIVRTFDTHEGYRMTVTAKNHSPSSVVLP